MAGNIATRTRAWTVRAKVKDAPASFQGHTHQVLALAVTSDGQFLVRSQEVWEGQRRATG